MKINHKRFFTGYKATFGSLTTEKVEGLDFLLSKFEEDQWDDIRLIAYVLATVKHESADTFKPIKEYRSRIGSKGRANQDRYWLSGYYGRGYVQITWEKNYEKLSKKLGVDLVANPNLALQPEFAYEILVIGMLQGLFTGKKLSDYINDKTTDYRNARRIVNGTDKADLIAGYASKFEKILRDSTEKPNTTATVISPNPIEIPAEIKPESVEVPDAVLSSDETVSAETTTTSEVATMTTTETEGRTVEVKTEKTETFGVKIPNINTAKTWLKYLFGGVTFGNIGAGVADLPPYIRISLAVSFIVLIIGTIVLFALYYRQIFDFVKAMNNLRADKDKHNPEIGAD